MTLREQLQRDEGKRNRPYRDSVGKLTIGYGHNLDDKPLSDRALDVILDDDIADAEADVANALPWALEHGAARLGVLVNMTFNMGIGGLLGFKKMLSAMRRGDYAEAAREMKASKWATQVGERATRLVRQMETGEWQ